MQLLNFGLSGGPKDSDGNSWDGIFSHPESKIQYLLESAMNLLKEARHFPEFVKLSHSVFAMPFALAALFLAEKSFPGWKALGLVVGAVVFARTAAMAFNRIVDASFDAANPRTAGRHLPSQRMSMPTAWLIVIVSIVLFVAVSIRINSLAGFLSPVALAIILGYSWTKRFTRFSHFVLGMALALAPLGAWVAARADLSDGIPWLLALAVVFWVAGFDMIYALQDLEFDRSHGLHSMMAALGPSRCLRLVRLLHLAMLLILVGVGLLAKARLLYYVGLTVVLGSLVWEQWLIRKLDQGKLQTAFLQANALASFGYLASVMLDVFWRN